MRQTSPDNEALTLLQNHLSIMPMPLLCSTSIEAGVDADWTVHWTACCGCELPGRCQPLNHLLVQWSLEGPPRLGSVAYGVSELLILATPSSFSWTQSHQSPAARRVRGSLGRAVAILASLVVQGGPSGNTSILVGV